MTIEEKAIKSLLDDEAFTSEIKLFCQSIIDEEFSKDYDKINCDLIDECAEILLSLDRKDENSAAMLLPFLSSKEIIKKATQRGFSSLSAGSRAAVIAAACATLLIGTNAAIAETTGVNLLSNLGDSVYEALEDLGIIKGAKNNSDYDIPQFEHPINDNENAQPKPEPQLEENEISHLASYAGKKSEEQKESSSSENYAVSLRLEFTDGFKSVYFWGEPLSLEGIEVSVVYKNGDVKSVPISQCSISGYNKALAATQKILVGYDGVYASFDISLIKKSPEQKIITGVDGTAPKKLVYTTQDAVLDLTGIKLRIIYSDGTYSNYYTENAISVVSQPDFSAAGTQRVKLRVANKADYTYSIIVQDSAADDSIESISLNYSSYAFNIGESLAHHDFYVRVRYKDSSKADNYIYYPEDREKLNIFNLDTSVETTSPKSFTIEYKGHYATATYVVSQRKSIAYSNWLSGMPKFVYYKGEELGYAFGTNGENEIERLVSSSVDLGNVSLTKGDDWALEIYYYESDHTPVIAERSQLDFVGYDAYKTGYQSIDIYYKGLYITSYLVFVYEDGGYCPSVRTANTVRHSYEMEDMKTDQFIKWYKCASDGEVIRNSSYSTLGAKNYLYDTTAVGRTTAYTLLTNGQRYDYPIDYVKVITAVSVNGFDRWHFIKLDNIDSYDYASDSITLHYADSTYESIYVNDLELSYAYTGEAIQPINKNSTVNSGFGFINIVLDRTKYANPEMLYSKKSDAFFYRDGYENTIQLMIEPKREDYMFTYDVECDEKKFKNANKIYLSSLDGGKTIYPNNVSISGVEWGEKGSYAATLKTEFEGIIFEMQLVINIVESVSEPMLVMKRDPYISITPSTGKELDCTDAVLSFVCRNSTEVEVYSQNFTYEIISGGRGHMIDETSADNKITVRYYYTSPEGFNYYVDTVYNTGFYINNLDFDYSPEEEAVVVTFDSVEEADYYIVEALGKTYQTKESTLYIRERLKQNVTFFNPVVTVTAVKFENGKEITSSKTVKKDKLVIK